MKKTKLKNLLTEKGKIKKHWKVMGVSGLIVLLALCSLSLLSSELYSPNHQTPRRVKQEYHTTNIRSIWREINTAPYGSRIIRVGDLNNDGIPELLSAQCKKFEDPEYGRKKAHYLFNSDKSRRKNFMANR